MSQLTHPTIYTRDQIRSHKVVALSALLALLAVTAVVLVLAIDGGSSGTSSVSESSRPSSGSREGRVGASIGGSGRVYRPTGGPDEAAISGGR